jgi:hypothetical protein
VGSITGVKRFQMLVVAFDQLSRQAKGRHYKESAHALSVGQCVMAGALGSTSLCFAGCQGACYPFQDV